MVEACANPAPWFRVVSVSVNGAPAPAAPGAVTDDTTRSGGRSSLTMVTCAADGDSTTPGFGSSVTTTDSSYSKMLSSMGVTTMVALAAPAGMVTLPGSAR